MAEISTLKRGAKSEGFASLSEEEVALAAKSGNQDATEWIVNRYKEFIKMRSHTFYLAGADQEDVMQEGMLGLYKAILGFEDDKGASFKTFAELCINRQIMSAVKSAGRKKHLPLNNYVSIDGQSGEETGGETVDLTAENTENNPEQILIEQENIDGIHGQIDKVLSRFEAEVMVHHLNGVNYQDIAKMLGREPKAIDNALQRIKKKLEKFLFN